MTISQKLANRSLMASRRRSRNTVTHLNVEKIIVTAPTATNQACLFGATRQNFDITPTSERLPLFGLIPFRPVADIGLEHLVLEVVAVDHRLGDVVATDDAHLHFLVHDRHVAGVTVRNCSAGASL